MKNFTYQAIHPNGKKQVGKISASTAESAKQQLKKQGLIVLKIHETQPYFWQRKAKPKTQDICLFTRQLATLLAAGISLSDALAGVAKEQASGQLKDLILSIHQTVLEGYSLAQALKQFPQAFSNLYCSTIYAGEQSGQLDRVLEQLADYIEQQHFATQKIQQALIYPALMIGISILIVFFLMTEVVPQILSMFTDNQQQLPLMTKILMASSHIFGIITPYLIILIVTGSYYIYKKRQNLAWKLSMDQWLTNLKLYFRFIQLTQVPRYLHTLRILLMSGVNVLESMSVGSQLMTNLAIKHKFDMATQEVREGIAISQALQNTGWFNSITIHLIQSGEKSGQIAMMMERAAHQIDNDRQQSIDTGLKLLEPMITVFMGGFVLFIVLAILLPIFQMQQLVQ